MTHPTDPACPFCRIVRGEVAAHVVSSDEVATAFLDARPLFPGHVLVAPLGHYHTITDLPEELVGPLFERVRRLAAAVQRATGAEGTFVAVNNTVSQSVPHLHVHVVPRAKGDGLRGFFWPRHRYEDETHAERVAEAIREALAHDA